MVGCLLFWTMLKFSSGKNQPALLSLCSYLLPLHKGGSRTGGTISRDNRSDIVLNIGEWTRKNVVYCPPCLSGAPQCRPQIYVSYKPGFPNNDDTKHQNELQGRSLNCFSLVFLKARWKHLAMAAFCKNLFGSSRLMRTSIRKEQFLFLFLFAFFFFKFPTLCGPMFL